ncbi:MAG: S26 family signal peptidase [Marinicaulis sp.]|nr:S26 family signal peptidase [Marinicaulis sp.]
MKTNRKYVAVTVLGIASIGIAALGNMPAKILYNPSPSAPIGFYAIDSRRNFSMGGFVAAQLPDDAEKLALERGYLPKNTPILKTISAVHGDEICIQSNSVFINSEPVALIQNTDSVGRLMPVKTECYELKAREYFLLSTAIENSFDSRYIGPVVEDNILGVATPLLIFSK